jgi:hypothetical protein
MHFLLEPIDYPEPHRGDAEGLAGPRRLAGNPVLTSLLLLQFDRWLFPVQCVCYIYGEPEQHIPGSLTELTSSRLLPCRDESSAFCILHLPVDTFRRYLNQQLVYILTCSSYKSDRPPVCLRSLWTQVMTFQLTGRPLVD